MLETILFLIAYTLGIATLIVQFVCYLKRMEYLVTIVFVISFLFLIISVSAKELNFIYAHRINAFINEIVTFSMLGLALTTPLNIHTERIIKFAPLANTIIFILTAVLFLLQLIGYFTGIKEIVHNIVEYFMFCSIGYSMFIILVSKPGMLIRHRDRIEKTSSVLFFSVYPVFILIEVFYDRLEFLHPFIPQGSYLLMLFFIFLSGMKLLDDIKRLTLFSQENSINQHVLARYGITPRETEVLVQIVKGKSYSQISEQLFISLPTVKTHISRAYKKMNVNNKIELINLLNVSKSQPDNLI